MFIPRAILNIYTGFGQNAEILNTAGALQTVNLCSKSITAVAAFVIQVWDVGFCIWRESHVNS
jgi:hypothetical protein